MTISEGAGQVREVIEDDATLSNPRVRGCVSAATNAEATFPSPLFDVVLAQAADSTFPLRRCPYGELSQTRLVARLTIFTSAVRTLARRSLARSRWNCRRHRAVRRCPCSQPSFALTRTFLSRTHVPRMNLRMPTTLRSRSLHCESCSGNLFASRPDGRTIFATVA